MNKLVKFIDASVITAIITGLLYATGYTHFVYYYQQLGIGIMAREPETPDILAKGFSYGGLLLLIFLVVVVALVYVASHPVQKFLSACKPTLSSHLDLIRVGIALLVFTILFSYLLDHVRSFAIESANRFYAQQLNSNARVVLQNGEDMKGDYGFLFISNKALVLIDKNPTSSKKLKSIVIIPHENIKFFTINK